MSRTSPAPLPVLAAVALDGSDAAVDVAAHLAVLLGAPLHLVHVLDVPAVDAYAGSYGGVLEDVDSTLRRAAERARLVTGDRVAVTVERIDSGGLGPQLTARADRSRLAVLQHRHLSRTHRLVTGSTVAGLAAHTTAPVLSVPEGWSSDGRLPVVAVGVQDVEEASHLLRLALDEAALRDARLVVTHAWWKPRGYDQAELDEAFRDEHLAGVRTALESALEPLRAKYPHTEVTLDLRHAPPAETLVEVAADASLLVLGRRHHLMPLGSHLGPTVRAVLHHSTCPVLLAPQVPVEEHHRTPTRTRDLAGVLY